MTLSQDAIEKTTKLVEFLAEVTAAVERDPVCDILEDPDAPDPVIWLDAPERVKGLRPTGVKRLVVAARAC